MPDSILMRTLLSKALVIATVAHDGQFDKAGMPYILHPLRVMMNVKTIYQKILAILHDIVEDTDITYEKLLTLQFPEDIVNDLKLLTKKSGQQYEEYLLAIKDNKNARKVKIADMKDNSNLLRFHELEEKHTRMIRKYHKGIKLLEPDYDERIDI